MSPLQPAASAKLAAALSDEEAEELGMTIAYLKRSLKAITVALDASAQLIAEKSLTQQQHTALRQRLFQVRDGIILLMGESFMASGTPVFSAVLTAGMAVYSM